MPVIPDMRTSVMRHPPCRPDRPERNAVAESYRRTASPDELRRKASDCRTASSSSTIWTTPLLVIGTARASDRFQSKAEHGSAIRVRLRPHLSAVGLDETLGLRLTGVLV